MMVKPAVETWLLSVYGSIAKKKKKEKKERKKEKRIEKKKRKKRSLETVSQRKQNRRQTGAQLTAQYNAGPSASVLKQYNSADTVRCGNAQQTCHSWASVDQA
ncbi:hypothetical protein TNCV_4797361 [Trichonephila clavipes]|nr:hypothetical protein TNCV_4797361 [Trichonephila clavipes]